MKTLSLLRCARSRALLSTVLAVPLVALAPLATPTPTSATACGDTYTVRPGDSIWSIGQACGVSMATLVRLNHPGAYLQPGQVLQLADPFALRSYVVQPGDTLSAIAQRVGVAPATLAAVNALTNPDLLRAGQVLRWHLADAVTGGAATPAAPGAAAGPGNGAASGPAWAGVYRVRPGDTLWSIAGAEHVSVAALAGANGITDPRLLRVGTLLRVPLATPAAPSAAGAVAPAAVTTVMATGAYRVGPGDTLWGIARSLGLTPAALAQMNGLNLATPIHPGQLLRYSILVYRGPSRAEVGAVLDQQAVAVGVEGALLKAVAWRESSWRMVDAPDGGIGVMQLMPDTVRWLKTTYLPGTWDPHDLTANVHAGAVLLALYSRLYAGDVARIAAAYHGGMGAVGAHLTREMSRYIRTVVAFRQAFLDGALPVY